MVSLGELICFKDGHDTDPETMRCRRCRTRPGSLPPWYAARVYNPTSGRVWTNAEDQEYERWVRGGGLGDRPVPQRRGIRALLGRIFGR